ncbi:DEKNAAC105494 [Brettanomyces naardenensis]|uniref:DEKNAAC105494 n=1 Tax=Brettanomyces naardenensis TaxID=13370 RepID=A0A448YTN7_BRENA|nr:DEKNAAC105494 [Brettanomyces naardenensis]
MSIPALPKIVDGKIQSRAVTFTNWNFPVELRTVELATASAEDIVKPNEILVKTAAASINPADCVIKSLTPPWFFGSTVKTMGGDFSGVVLKAGSKTVYKPGDRVHGDMISPTAIAGSLSEYLLFDPEKIVFCGKIPEGMSFIQAAATPLAGGASYEALKAHEGPLQGAHLLVLGAGTSVGSYAIQFAKSFFGVKTVTGTCSPRSFERVRALGADNVVDYTKRGSHELEGILEDVKENGKYDIVIDCVRDPILYGNLDLVLKPKAEKGVFVQVMGSKSLDYKNVSIVDILPPRDFFIEQTKEVLHLSKFRFASLMEYPDKTYLPALHQLWARNQLHIDIDSIHKIEDFQVAYDKVASCGAQGKVILTF